jgi:hypothetical protein
MKLAIILASFACVLATRTALASDSDVIPVLPEDGWFVLPGVNLSASKVDHKPAGPVAGSEVSFAHLRGDTWLGGYLDAVGDFQSERFRLSIGPELGANIAGVDGGFLAEVGRGGPRYGYTYRVMLTCGYVTFYLRDGEFPKDHASYYELGALLKVPMRLFRDLTPSGPVIHAPSR